MRKLRDLRRKIARQERCLKTNWRSTRDGQRDKMRARLAANKAEFVRRTGAAA